MIEREKCAKRTKDQTWSSNSCREQWRSNLPINRKPENHGMMNYCMILQK